MSDVDETTGLTTSIKDETNQNEDKVTYVKLGGGHQKTLSLNNAEEYITYDFFVKASEEVLSTNDNLKNAIKESVDCNLEQIQDLNIKEIDDGSSKKECRVSGKVYTDDWELPMLQKKFQKIISERVLSGNLQQICQLEDRPMIRRFFCKTSRDINKKKNGGINKLKTTPSLRTLKDETTPTNPAIITPTTKPIGKKTESASYSEREKEQVSPSKTTGDPAIITPTTKPIGKKTESASYSEREKEQVSPSPKASSPLKTTGDEGIGGNGNSSSDSNSSSGKQSEGDKKDTTTTTISPSRPSDDQCECFCIVL
eukprot:CAMPEP_0201593066 /NCGR_PEP_ID=MMETSP0190_2-20130828/190789_1 /ASSEMBLY_ACC=CAM_ASM_000263 /TAXON_ID=37353 /ORGANISM="Rosalina sp." /LENGTH=311 /DNA_ID=CAMNT_0048052119 /DNA_START=118 /DNA_END=1053 /DNA_ORIENTATION=+